MSSPGFALAEMPIQIWNECVWALLKFLTFSNSTTIHVSDAVRQRRDAQRPARTWIEIGPVGRKDVVRPSRIRQVRVDEIDIPTGTAAHDDVAVADDAKAGPGLSGKGERRNVEVDDGLIAKPADRCDAEQLESGK